MLVWLNGSLLPAEGATVPALDRGVLWGYGLFETMRVYGGRPYALTAHLERLREGAGLLEIELPADGELADAVASVVGANGLSEAGARITVTAGAGPPDPAAMADGPPNVIASTWPVADYSSLYEDGASFVTLPGGGRPLAGVKTTSYATSVAGRVLARRAGADDALFLSDDGHVLEATGSNLFIVTGSRLVTPPLTGNVLPGVTRQAVMAAAADPGLDVAEAPVAIGDLYDADEVILTSSLREVYPARSVDGREVTRGPVCAALRASYRRAVARELGLPGDPVS